MLDIYYLDLFVCSMAATFLCIFPSSIHLLVRPSHKCFLLSLVCDQFISSNYSFTCLFKWLCFNGLNILEKSFEARFSYTIPTNRIICRMKLSKTKKMHVWYILAAIWASRNCYEKTKHCLKVRRIVDW